MLKTYCMSKYITTLSIFLTFASVASAQVKKTGCNCPGNTMAAIEAGNRPDTAFHFSNGSTVILCGYQHEGGSPAIFSEFILSVCGEDEIIDFWDAMLTCRLRFDKDTLFVEDIRPLPTGEQLAYEEHVWTTEQIYFRGGEIVRQLQINSQIRKYDRSEIQMVLEQYETAAPGLDDAKMTLANKLFLAAISGDKKARQYFLAFRTRFGTLDGAFSEEYSDLAAMLELWDEKDRDMR